MSTTIAPPARNGRVYADEPPDYIRAALEAVVIADRGLFGDRMAFKRNNSDSNLRAVVESQGHLDAVSKHAERLLDDYLPIRYDAVWPIAGRCIGFTAKSKYGMSLRVEADRCTLNAK